MSLHGRTLVEMAIVRICQLDDLDDLAALVAELRGERGSVAPARPAEPAKKNIEPRPLAASLGAIPPLPTATRRSADSVPRLRGIAASCAAAAGGRGVSQHRQPMARRTTRPTRCSSNSKWRSRRQRAATASRRLPRHACRAGSKPRSRSRKSASGRSCKERSNCSKSRLDSFVTRRRMAIEQSSKNLTQRHGDANPNSQYVWFQSL